MAVLAVLDKLEYENKRGRDRKGVINVRSVLRNGGEFILTTNPADMDDEAQEVFSDLAPALKRYDGTGGTREPVRSSPTFPIRKRRSNMNSSRQRP